MNNDTDKLGAAILCAIAMSFVLCVLGIIVGRHNGDFRAVYLYFQAIGLIAMLIKGVLSRESRFGFPAIIAALAICAAIDFWLGIRGPIYLD